MSPKAANYKANSIVYFRGDVNERVFILKGGRVVLKYNDIETGQEMQDLIQTGEFFGVKSGAISIVALNRNGSPSSNVTS